MKKKNDRNRMPILQCRRVPKGKLKKKKTGGGVSGGGRGGSIFTLRKHKFVFFLKLGLPKCIFKLLIAHMKIMVLPIYYYR